MHTGPGVSLPNIATTSEENLDRSGDGTPTVLHRYFNGTLCWVSAALKLKVKEGWPSQSPPRHKTEHTVEMNPFLIDENLIDECRLDECT